MKIFNWVHRRFHNGALKDGLARNVKKAESITNDADKQALLKQVALVDVLDGWKDGILTIGTLGLDPVKPFNQQNEYFVLESEEEEEEDDQEQYSVDNNDENDDEDEFNDNVEDEVNPLLFTTFDHNFEDLASKKDLKSDGVITFDGVNLAPIKTKSSNHPENDPEGRKKAGRITLAELFLADSDIKKKPADSGEIDATSIKKPVVRTKNGLSFAKKLIPNVGEDSRPMKKIHQLMRRMLKRKIHPELEGKGHQNKSGLVEVDDNNKERGVESVSLLQTPPGPAI